MYYDWKKMTRYKVIHDSLLTRLIISNQDKKKKWSIVIERQLNFAIVWASLFDLEQKKYSLKTITLKKWLNDSNYCVQWLQILNNNFTSSKSEDDDFTSAITILKAFCDDASKTRALLQNVRSQISLIVRKRFS